VALLSQKIELSVMIVVRPSNPAEVYLMYSLCSKPRHASVIEDHLHGVYHIKENSIQHVCTNKGFKIKKGKVIPVQAVEALRVARS
jgi:hypothetical protein